MGASKTQDIPARLEGVRRRFERWRQAHRSRSRIPDSLWAAAARVAGRYGIHRTSRALRLDYYSLKERVEQQTTAVPDPAARAVAATFLQLPPPADHGRPTLRVGARAVSVGRCECRLELEDAAGAKMRVHLKNIATPDLAALSRSFWNPAP